MQERRGGQVRRDYSAILARYMQDPWLKERADQVISASNASDYSTVFLPWGPKWTAKRVRGRGRGLRAVLPSLTHAGRRCAVAPPHARCTS